MSGDENRFFPWKIGVDISVEVDQIGLKIGCRFEQPVGGAIDVVPWIVHPFEFKIAFVKFYIRNFRQLLMLLFAQFLAHCCQAEFDTRSGESSDQIEAEGPD